MSEPTTPKPEPAAQPSTRARFTIVNILIGIFIGILTGVAGYHYMQGNLEKITQVLLTASYVAFAALIVSLVAMLAFRQYLTRSILGPGADKVGTVIQDAQKAADHLTDRVAAHLLRDAPEDIQQGARSILPRLLNIFFWGRLRNWWWQWIIGIFVSIGGLTGTMLLMNQNILIQRQISLEEASRRSALVVLMSNIMDKADREIEKQQDLLPVAKRDSARFQLSQSLIGQIAALSHSFKPYRYMNGDTLITEPLSPERGQLLITLTLLPLDTMTIQKIYQSATFEGADLQSAVLSGVYLSGANLYRANLERANLYKTHLRKTVLNEATLKTANFYRANLEDASLKRALLNNAFLKEANLIRANMSEANLTKAILVKANMRDGILHRINLSGANLEGAFLNNAFLKEASLTQANLSAADLSGASLNKADLREAVLNIAILIRADLKEANLKGAFWVGANLTSTMGLTFQVLKQCSSLYQAKGVPQDILTRLKQENPELFENPSDF